MPTKTHLPALTETAIALKDLVPHPMNARASSREVYEADDIATLAASIAALGLLNPLIVQKVDVDGKSTWGVLAGGRRLAALRRLAEDGAAKGWGVRTKIACRALAEDVGAATAITVAENVTQKAMDPLDEYEAFARMIEEGGHDLESVARVFGVEVRRVAERLRYGRVHPAIRQAARAGHVTLDVMKAFAAHPDHAVQWAVYEATEGSYRQPWSIRDRLEKAGIKVGSPLGQYVEAEYRAAGGEIAADLIPEDSVLTDEALVERLLLEKLAAHAEAERQRLGFAWAEGRRTADYEALRPYGRTYPSVIEPEGDAAERCVAIADRLLVIEELMNDPDSADEGTDFDALENEHADLTEEHERLTTGWTEEQLAKGGVIAHWQYDRVVTVLGLVRPEDRDDRSKGVTGGADGDGGASGAAGGSASTDAGEGDAFFLSESLAADLRTERAMVIGAGLSANPALAQDLVLFKVASDLMEGVDRSTVSWAFGVKAVRGERPHGKPDGIDGRAGETVAALREGLDLTWWDATRPVAERFEAFRLLGAEMKARIVAVAAAEAVAPSPMTYHEPLLAHVARQVVPDLRSVWRPTSEAFFGRLKKAVLLRLLAQDLQQPEEAARLATAKKVEIVDYLERLFEAPFATLTPEQRDAVETWCPPGMEVPEAEDRGLGTDASVERDAAKDAFDPDEEFGGEDDPDAAGEPELEAEAA